MKYTAFFAVLAILLVLGGCSQGIAPAAQETVPVIAEIAALPEDVLFSIPGGFYNDTVSVELSNNTDNAAAVIRYTTDGSVPVITSSVYSEALTKTSRSGEKLLVIRAALFDDEKMLSRACVTNTYIVGEIDYEIADRYDVPVICLSTDNSNLWDYETGIFADGKMRDEWWQNIGNRRPGNDTIFTAPANWWQHGAEWERPVHVEIFEPDGTRVINQDAGIRIAGGWSRGNERQKSVRLWARREYDLINNKFRYEFFPYLTTQDGENARIDSFKQLTLRNGGNDHWNTRIRDEVMQDIASQAGLHTQASRAAVIYLNGAFYGVTQIKQHYDRFSLEDSYNLPDDNITLLEQATSGGGYRVLNGLHEEERIFRALVKKISTGLAKTEEGRKVIEESIDVYDILKYYAVQIYIGNGDWPHNNYKIWKYNAAEVSQEIKGSDGRWRYLIYDTDFGLGIYDSNRVDRLKACLEERGDGGLFAGLMMYAEYRNYFSRTIADMMNFYFTADNLDRTIALRMLEIAKEIPAQHDTKDWSSQCQNMINWNKGRRIGIDRQMIMSLDCWDPFDVAVSKSEAGGQVFINEYEMAGESYNCAYYLYTGAFAEARALPGYKFRSWTVNGQEIADARIVFDNYFVKGETVTARANFEPISQAEALDAKLLINEAVYDGFDCDYVEIYNPTPYAVHLYNWSLSDSEKKQFKFVFPKVSIAPYSFVTVYCTKDISAAPKGAMVAPFGLREGVEEICLFYQGVLVDKSELPLLKNGKESYGRYPDGSDSFVHLQQITPSAPNNLGERAPVVFDYMKNRVLVRGSLMQADTALRFHEGELYLAKKVTDYLGTGSLNELTRMANRMMTEIDGEKFFPLSAINDSALVHVIYLEDINSLIINRKGA